MEHPHSHGRTVFAGYPRPSCRERQRSTSERETGRLALKLARREWKVTALDPNLDMLSIAELAAAREGLPIRFIRSSIEGCLPIPVSCLRSGRLCPDPLSRARSPGCYPRVSPSFSPRRPSAHHRRASRLHLRRYANAVRRNTTSPITSPTSCTLVTTTCRPLRIPASA